MYSQQVAFMGYLRQAIKWLILVPILMMLTTVGGVVAMLETGYYYLKGYSYDSIQGGYWHRKTGARA